MWGYLIDGGVAGFLARGNLCSLVKAGAMMHAAWKRAMWLGGELLGAFSAV
jgi:hypothetical protein